MGTAAISLAIAAMLGFADVRLACPRLKGRIKSMAPVHQLTDVVTRLLFVFLDGRLASGLPPGVDQLNERVQLLGNRRYLGRGTEAKLFGQVFVEKSFHAGAIGRRPANFRGAP